MLARSWIALTRTRRSGEGAAWNGCADTASGFRPSEPDQRMAMVALGGRAQNRVRRCRTRRFGTEPVLLSVFPFLLLCQTGRRRVMGMNERVMGRERQEGERQETKRETMSMGRDSVGVQGEGVRPSSWAKGSTAQAGGVRCTVYGVCAVPPTGMIIITIIISQLVYCNAHIHCPSPLHAARKGRGTKKKRRCGDRLFVCLVCQSSSLTIASQWGAEGRQEKKNSASKFQQRGTIEHVRLCMCLQKCWTLRREANAVDSP